MKAFYCIAYFWSILISILNIYINLIQKLSEHRESTGEIGETSENSEEIGETSEKIEEKPEFSKKPEEPSPENLHIINEAEKELQRIVHEAETEEQQDIVKALIEKVRRKQNRTKKIFFQHNQICYN